MPAAVINQAAYGLAGHRAGSSRLSEVPFLREVERWGVMTIGTGLGSARCTNRPASGPGEE